MIGRALFLVVLLASGVAAQSDSAPTLRRGTIAGEVIDAATMHALEGATVILSPVGGAGLLSPPPGGPGQFALARSIVTGATGRYEFGDLPAGDYQLRVQRIGYRAVTLEVRLGVTGDARVSVGLTVAPIRLQPLSVRAEPTASYGRTEAGTEYEGAVRVAAARIRQRQFLASDVRELTHPDVTEAVTLGEADLFRAFQRLPGVTSRDDYTSELWTRGARPDLTRVNFDGLPLFGPFHTFGLLTGVGTDAVGAAFLHPGVRPASIGEGGGAVIDIRSRSGGGSGNVRGLAELSVLSGRLALDRRSRDGRTSWMVAGRRSYLDWLLGLIGTLSPRSDISGYPYHFGDVAARVDHELGGGQILETSALLTRDVLSEDVFEVLRANRLSWGNRALRTSLVRSGGRVTARHTIGVSRFSARTDTMQTVSLQEILTRPFSAPHYSPVEVPVDASVLHAQAAGEFESTAGVASSRPWSLGYGLAWQRLRMSDNVASVEVLRDGGSARVPTRDDRWVASLWGERRWTLGDRLAVATGLRVEGGPRAANVGAVRPMPRVHFRFTADSQTTVSAGVGRSTQHLQGIGRTEWGRDALLVASPLWIAANDGVPALVADLATIGVERWLGGAWLVGTTAYHRRSTGFVTRDPRPGVAFARQLVVGSERASGLELSARKLAGVVTGSAGYTLASARTSAGRLTFPSTQDRRHSVDLTVLARAAPGVHFGAVYTFATGAPYTRIYSPLEEDAQSGWRLAPARAEAPNAKRMRSHETLDLLLEVAFGRTTRWTVFAQLRNVLDRENPLVYLDYQPCVPDQPVFVQCGDRFNAGVRQIPLIGFRATF